MQKGILNDSFKASLWFVSQLNMYHYVEPTILPSSCCRWLGWSLAVQSLVMDFMLGSSSFIRFSCSCNSKLNFSEPSWSWRERCARSGTGTKRDEEKDLTNNVELEEEHYWIEKRCKINPNSKRSFPHICCLLKPENAQSYKFIPFCARMGY